MTAMLSPPRLDLIDRLTAAVLEVDRHRERLQVFERRLRRARRHLVGSDALPPLRRAYLDWAEAEYGAALDQLRAVRREARALCRHV